MQDFYDNKSLATQICSRCVRFYGNPKTDRLCSQCYKFFQPISAFAGLYIHTKTISPQKSPNKIKSGLLLYSFKGHDDWRLRSKHSTSLIVNHTKYLRKEASMPSYQKTLKYVRKFKDIRTGANDRELRDYQYYYLSYRVIRQLKGVTSLNVVIIDGINTSIFKKLCQILSNLNPNSFTLNFPFSSGWGREKGNHLETFLIMIQRMRNLNYFSTGDLANLNPEDDNFKWPKYQKKMSSLRNIKDVTLGISNDNNLRDFINLFLNHEHLKKIRCPIMPLMSSEPMQIYFNSLSNIKELDCLCLRTGEICTYAETLIYAPLYHFLKSIKSVETLGVNHTQFIPNYDLNNDSVLPTEITNIRNIAIKGYICNPLIRVMQAIKGLDSLQININWLNKNNTVINAINKILLEKFDLKELTIKFDQKQHSILIALLHNVALPKLRSFSLDLSEDPYTTFDLIRGSEFSFAFIEFLRNQKVLQDFVLKLCIPIDYEALETFLHKLLGLLKINSINLHLERSKDSLFSEKDYIIELDTFNKTLEKSPYLEYELNPKGYAILRSRKS